MGADELTLGLQEWAGQECVGRGRRKLSRQSSKNKMGMDVGRAVAVCPAGWRGHGTLTTGLGSVFKVAETPGEAVPGSHGY